MPRSFARTALTLLAAATLAGTGLAGAGVASADPVATHSTTVWPAAVVRTVGPRASGKTVTLRKSQRLKIELPTAVDGGYRWVITRHPNHRIATVSKPKLTPYPHQPGTVGYPFRTTYVITAVGIGTARITLVERGPGSSAQIARRFTLRLQVTAAAPRTVSATHSCTLTSTGKCIQGGEFCPQSSYGQSGWDASGTRYVCTGDSTHPHWELP